MTLDARFTNHETRRLTLRVPTEADFEAWFDWYQDEGTRTGLHLAAAPRWEVWRGLAMMIGHWHLRGFGMWTMVDKASGQLVGRGGLFFPEGWPGLEVGWLVAPHARGQGYATEVGEKALELAFTVLGSERVCSVIRAENVRSISVAKRLGERFVGPTRIRDTMEVDLYAITRAEWSERLRARGTEAD